MADQKAKPAPLPRREGEAAGGSQVGCAAVAGQFDHGGGDRRATQGFLRRPERIGDGASDHHQQAPAVEAETGKAGTMGQARHAKHVARPDPDQGAPRPRQPQAKAGAGRPGEFMQRPGHQPPSQRLVQRGKAEGGKGRRRRCPRGGLLDPRDLAAQGVPRTGKGGAAGRIQGRVRDHMFTICSISPAGKGRRVGMFNVYTLHNMAIY